MSAFGATGSKGFMKLWELHWPGLSKAVCKNNSRANPVYKATFGRFSTPLLFIDHIAPASQDGLHSVFARGSGESCKFNNCGYDPVRTEKNWED
jgi:hypothetical protein